MARPKRPRLAGGRVTPKPCKARRNGEFCAPLNHIRPEGEKEYWACSCGRRFSVAATRRYLKDHPEFEPR
jgi:hypothetical protein